MQLRVYISGPITAGNRNHNYYQAIEAQRELMLAGFAPLNPMMTLVLPFAWQEGYSPLMWIKCDLPWVEVADAVLRLPGESAGAEVEVEYALRCGVPVFESINELKRWRDFDQKGRTTSVGELVYAIVAAFETGDVSDAQIRKVREQVNLVPSGGIKQALLEAFGRVLDARAVRGKLTRGGS